MLVTAFPYLYNGFYAQSIWWKNFAKHPIPLSLNVASVILTFLISLKNSSISFWKANLRFVLEKTKNRFTSVVFKSDRKHSVTSGHYLTKDSIQWSGVKWTAG